MRERKVRQLSINEALRMLREGRTSLVEGAPKDLDIDAIMELEYGLDYSGSNDGGEEEEKFLEYWRGLCVDAIMAVDSEWKKSGWELQFSEDDGSLPGFWNEEGFDYIFLNPQEGKARKITFSEGGTPYLTAQEKDGFFRAASGTKENIQEGRRALEVMLNTPETKLISALVDCIKDESSYDDYEWGDYDGISDYSETEIFWKDLADMVS